MESCYITTEFALSKEKPMSTLLQKSILFVGNHAQSHLKYVQKHFNGKYRINCLNYQSGDPFEDKDSNKIIFDDVEIDFNGSYDLNNLTLGLEFIIEHQPLLKNSDVIIGDPSEIIFQAFSFSRLNENPFFIKSDSLETKIKDRTLNLFIYPMGMICSDIRKEMSNLLYVLKKHESQTFLLRKDEKELDLILDEVFSDFNETSIYELEDKIEGLEHLIGKTKELME